MLQMEQKHWQIIQTILSKYPYTFYAFGSRVKNKAKKFSDFDLCYKETIPGHIITTIEGELEDSDLPFKVELIDWNHCDTDFQQLIEKDLVPLSSSGI